MVMNVWEPREAPASVQRFTSPPLSFYTVGIAFLIDFVFDYLAKPDISNHPLHGRSISSRHLLDCHILLHSYATQGGQVVASPWELEKSCLDR